MLVQINKLEAALKEGIDWLENAPISYSNGVTYNGVDEGDVLGWKGHSEVVKIMQEALKP
jgi:hypothetical protein